eukprot:2224-Heterococcus_DN1.PRE.5
MAEAITPPLYQDIISKQAYWIPDIAVYHIRSAVTPSAMKVQMPRTPARKPRQLKLLQQSMLTSCGYK